jgi:hypothetical protein
MQSLTNHKDAHYETTNKFTKLGKEIIDSQKDNFIQKQETMTR